MREEFLDKVTLMLILKKLIFDHTAALVALRAAINSEPIDTVALTDAERRVDQLEARILAYHARSPKALVAKLRFVHELALSECENSASARTLLAFIADEVAGMLTTSGRRRQSISAQAESHQ